jgi:small-conductance mechanosensitive channel/CRP-like cAMP-binding protein
MKFLDQLLILGQTWTGSLAILGMVLVLLILRRFLPAAQRTRIRLPLFFLGLSLVLGLSATATLKVGAYTIWGLLSFLDLLSLIISVTSLLSLVAFDLVLSRTRVRIPAIVRDLIQASIVFLIVVTILYQRGLDPLSLLTTSAVLTAVVGLALQNTIANLFAGISLHLDQTLGLNDWIQVGEKVGRIAEIKWRSTLLWTEDSDLLIVPNSQLLDAEVFNFSRPDSVQRMSVKIGFHYRHPPNEVKRVLLEAVRGVAGVRSQPAADCILRDFADSAVVYELRYWIDDYTSHAPIESEVRTRIWYATRRAGLEIPFPIRTIVMPSVTTDVATVEHKNGLAKHLAALAQTGLFTMLDEEARTRLAAGMKTVEFGASEDILHEDKSGDLHLICSGEVAIYLTLDDIRHEVATLKPGDVFGELPLISEVSQPAGYQAKSDTTCAILDHAVLAQLLPTQPKLAADLATALAAHAMALDSVRQEHSVEAQMRHTVDTKSRLLAKVQRVFRAE